MVDQVEREFAVSLETLNEVKERLKAEFVKGLKEDGQCVKMLPTFVHKLPDETVHGDFMAIDLGGTNFRVGKYKIRGGKIEGEPVVQPSPVEASVRQAEKQEVLFGFLAEEIAKFISSRLEDDDIADTIPLGFTFSFPVEKSSISSGKLLRWTKDYKAEDAIGKDPTTLLQEALKTKGVEIVKIKALINDTTATLLAGAGAGEAGSDCYVGLILGTGTNACYLEKLDKSTIPKYKGDFSEHSHIIINCEWGAFGEGGQLENVMTEYDRRLEEKVENPGQQLYEKMISGKYLGEIVRLVLTKLVADKLLFGGKSSTELEAFGQFESTLVSAIEEGDADHCKQLLKENLSIEASDADCQLVKRVCEAVSKRAARLAATGVVALVEKIDKLNGCTVAVDGSLFEKHPTFEKTMKEAMDELAPGNNIKMTLTKDGSGRGAAIAVAMVQ